MTETRKKVETEMNCTGCGRKLYKVIVYGDYGLKVELPCPDCAYENKDEL